MHVSSPSKISALRNSDTILKQIGNDRPELAVARGPCSLGREHAEDTELSAGRNLTRHALQPRENRWACLGQRPVIAWFTGLSGAGKSSIAGAVDRALTARGCHTMVLDGDNLRLGLNRDLGFSARDRAENIRRAAETARLMAETGLVTIFSLISPFRAEREAARAIAGDIPFLEIFIDTPLSVCEARDPKGLYDRARAGAIPDFTGISAPYEAPERPDLAIPTQGCSVEESAALLIPELLRLSAPGRA